MSFFKNLFSRKKKETPEPELQFSNEQYEKDYEEKEKGLEAVLGKIYNMVGHAIIPFDVGGTVDMYYFPNHIPGTGFATMELLDPDGNGPKPNALGTYELVAFTKELYDQNEGAFNDIERRFCGIFTTIANYSFEAVLKPNDTCELPGDDDETKYIIFDNYQPENRQFKIGDRNHHLLLCVEIFREEMEFARQNGGGELFKKLKAAGHYPYSDLNRVSVV